MTTTEAFAALMPDSVGFRTRYRSEPEMIGHYPWTYSDARRRLYDRPAYEYEDLYTAEQMRAMFDAATERAAKQEREECAKLCDQQAADHSDFKNTEAAIGCDGCAAAIRARDEGVSNV